MILCVMLNSSFPSKCTAACRFCLIECSHLNRHLFHRVKIVKEKALPEIENYMFEDHDQIRQAATECMCNLVTCKEVRGDKQLKNLT